MNVVKGITHWNRHYPRLVLAIGVFDGLHHGHRQLIRKTLACAKQIKGTPVVMTFDPHPMKVLHARKSPPLISSLEYRLRLLEESGMKVCLVVHFTKRFAQMDPIRFIEHYLVRKMAVAEVFVGEDFHFGRHRRGDVDLLKKIGKAHGFRAHKVSLSKERGRSKISSSSIRDFIAQGDIDHAQRLLDRPVTIMGRVIKGDRRGATLGFPTANLDSTLTGFAPRGVYCVRVLIKSREYYGMANIGSRPSFKKNAPSNIEVHLFDFGQTLYGRTLIMEFLKKIRSEKRFSSREELIQQLHQDEQYARQWFFRHLSV